MDFGTKIGLGGDALKKYQRFSENQKVRSHGSRSGEAVYAERAKFKTSGRTSVLTQRRPTALAVACALTLTFVPASLTWAASSLTTSLSTPAASSEDSEASQVGDGPDISMASVTKTPSTPVRLYHRRARPVVRSAARAKPLPSRSGGDLSSGVGSVVGRLAVVMADNTPIRAGREREGRVLSLVPKGQNLAISGETPTDYAVLMIDHSLGYIAKDSVQLLNYQVVSDASTDTLGQRMVQEAETYLGVTYVWGGNTRAGIDCSGFVKAVYAANGIVLPRVSGDQAAVGYDVPHNVAAGDWQQWAPGDRLYFACHHPRIDHTGMYIGNGLFIHASVGHNNQVAIDRVDNAYYSAHLVAVRRSQELLGEPAMPGDAASQAPEPDAPTNYPSVDSESGQE
jgi:cell wall-associated NlpC family hydrolase